MVNLQYIVFYDSSDMFVEQEEMLIHHSQSE